MVTFDAGMIIDGVRNLKPFHGGPCRLPYVFLITLQLSHSYMYIISLFFVILSFSSGATRRPLMVSYSLKWTWVPTFPKLFLKLSKKPFVYYPTDVAVIFVVTVVIVLAVVSGVIFCWWYCGVKCGM